MQISTQKIYKFASIFVLIFFSIYWYPATILQIGGIHGDAIPLVYKLLRFVPYLLIISISYRYNSILILLFSTALYLIGAIRVESLNYSYFSFIINVVFSFLLVERILKYLNVQEIIQTTKFIVFIFSISFVLYISGVVIGLHPPRFSGTVGGPNIMGGIVCVFFFFYQSLNNRINNYKWYLALFIIILLSTMSVGSLLAFVSTFILFNFTTFLILIFIISIILLTLEFSFNIFDLLYAELYNNALFTKLNFLYLYLIGKSDTPGHSVESRLYDTYKFIDSINNNPYELLYGTGKGFHESYYIYLLVETGLIGFIFFAIILALVIRKFNSKILIFTLIHSLFSPTFALYAYWFFVLLFNHIERLVEGEANLVFEDQQHELEPKELS